MSFGRLIKRWRQLPYITPHRLRQLWYAPVLALAMGLMMLRMLLMARVLNVQGFGEFSAGMLVSGTFRMFGCFGLQSMLQREWPVQIVRRVERHSLVRAMQCHVVTAACCVAGLIAAAVGFMPAGITPALLAVGLLHGLSQQWFLVVTVESRSRGDSLRFARQNFVRAVAVMAVSVVAAVVTGSAVICLLVDAVVTLAFWGFYLQGALNKAHTRLSGMLIASLALRRLPRVSWVSALTLTLVMTLGFGMINADRWVAASVLGVGEFAHYAFAWIVLSIAQSAQLMINTSIYPLLARRYAEYGPAVAFRVCMIASGSLIVFCALTGLPAAAVLNYGIRHWYPQYVDALVLLPWFLVVAVLRTSDFWSSFLLICGYESLLLKISLMVAALGVPAWLFLVWLWSSEPSKLLQVGLLPVILASLAFVSVAVTSWKVRNCAAA